MSKMCVCTVCMYVFMLFNVLQSCLNMKDVLLRWVVPETATSTWTKENVLTSCIAYQSQLSFYLLSSPNPNLHTTNLEDKDDAYILPLNEILIKGNCLNSNAIANSFPGRHCAVCKQLYMVEWLCMYVYMIVCMYMYV